ncbi:Aspartyl/glutamyl-tRNA(Asn/Gln) amidotransferase B subunit [Trinorchestia longiramus]|nr:Aspartyl/glutamyl-tRNA(Asn/Gln) amidotransferase B subunit [Trinorchestia longiramus]
MLLRLPSATSTIRQCIKNFSVAHPKTSVLSDAWIGVVGLEVHAQINCSTKIFCRSPNQPNAPVNTCIGVFDTAHPGTLPVLNKACVEAGVITALALNARINPVSYFDRKHYFYPDLPAGYQITQQRVALAENGLLSFVVLPPDGAAPYVQQAQLLKLQLEEDSGKSIYSSKLNKVLVDLNRAGVGLMELVFSPCLSGGAEAAALVRHLGQLLRRLGVCTANMNEGALRVDANVSVHKAGSPLGTRTEIKNLNSIRSLREAIEHELSRQVAVLEDGGVVVNETRSFDQDSGTTASMRDKEGLQDYRFMPEFNLPPLRVYDSGAGDPPSSSDCIDGTELRKRSSSVPLVTPELLEALTQRCQLTALDASALIMYGEMCRSFLCMVDQFCGPGDLSSAQANTAEYAARLLLHCHQHVLPQHLQDTVTERVDSSQLWSCAQLVQRNHLRYDRAKEVIARIALHSDARSPQQIAEAENWIQSIDDAAIDAAATEAVYANPVLVEKFLRREGNLKKQQRPLKGLVRYTLEALRRDNDSDVSKRDGEVEASKRDGEVEALKRDGEVAASKRDCEVEASKRDGEVKAPKRDGEVEASKRDGEIEALKRNGEVKASKRDGEVAASKRDGEVEASKRDGEVAASKRDGEVAASKRDGEVEVQGGKGPVKSIAFYEKDDVLTRQGLNRLTVQLLGKDKDVNAIEDAVRKAIHRSSQKN